MFEQTQEQHVPVALTWTDDQIRKAMERPELRPGWYHFVVTGEAKNGVFAKGHLNQMFVAAPMDSFGEKKSPTIQHRLTLPFVNTEIEGHAAPNTFGFCHEYLHAVDSVRFPRFPKKEGDVWTTEQGDILDYEQSQTAKEQIVRAVYEEINRRWQDPTVYEGESFFGLVEKSKDGKYLNITKIHAELPLEAELITSNFSA